LEDVHGRGGDGARLQGTDEVGGQGAVSLQLVGEVHQLMDVGHFVMEEQVSHLGEGGPHSQLLDEVTAVEEAAVGTVHVADFGAGDDYTAKADVFDGAVHGILLSNASGRVDMGSEAAAFDGQGGWPQSPGQKNTACHGRHRKFNGMNKIIPVAGCATRMKKRGASV